MTNIDNMSNDWCNKSNARYNISSAQHKLAIARDVLKEKL